MVFNPTLDRNVTPFLSVPGSTDFLRESNSTHFTGVLFRVNDVDVGDARFRQVGAWALRAASSLGLANGEIIRAGSRRYRVELVEDDGLGMIDADLSLVR